MAIRKQNLGAFSIPGQRSTGLRSISNVGIEQFGRAISSTAAAFEQGRQAKEITRATSEALTGLNDLEISMDGFENTDAMDVEFSKGSTALSSEISKSLQTDREKQAFDEKFKLLFEPRRISVDKKMRNRQGSEARAFLNESLITLSDQASKVGNDAELVVLQKTASDLILENRQAGHLTSEQAQRNIQNFQEDSARSAAIVDIDENPALAFEALKNDDYTGMDPVDRVQLKNRAEARINQLKRKAELQEGQKRSVATDAIKDVNTILSAGKVPDDVTMANTELSVAIAADDKIDKAWQVVQNEINLQRKAIVTTPLQLGAFLDDLEAKTSAKAGGANITEARQINQLRELKSTMETELSRDQLSWASRAGVADILPLNFADPSSAAKRQNDAIGVARYYGRKVIYTTTEERAKWIEDFQSAPVASQLGFIQDLQNNFPGAAAFGVLSEISNDAPRLAWISGIAIGGDAGEQTANEALAGLKDMKDGFKVNFPSADVTLAIADSLGAGLNDNLANRTNVIATAEALYVHQMKIQGKSEADPFDAAVYERQVHKALGGSFDQSGDLVGGKGEWNGRDLVLPTTLTAAQFDKTISSMNDLDLSLASVGGVPPFHMNQLTGEKIPMTARDLRDAALIPVGDGQYLVSMDGQGGELVLGGAEGGFYVMDIKKQAPGVLGRKPVPFKIDLPEIDLPEIKLPEFELPKLFDLSPVTNIDFASDDQGDESGNGGAS